MKKVVAVLFSLMLISAVQAQPLENEKGIAFGPLAGIQKANDADEARFIVGAALRGKINPFLGLEGSINYRQEEYGDGQVTVRSWPVMVTGLIYPLPVVYGLIGGGWHNSTIDVESDLDANDPGDDTRSEFGWHVGGGLEIPVAEKVNLVGDVRYVFLDNEFEDIVTADDDVNNDFYMITAGFLFGF